MSPKEFAARMRRAPTPVIGVISGQRFRIDLRTILPGEEKKLLQSIEYTLK
jgi:hypothetical protein